MTTAPRKSAGKTRGKPFEPGNSGKPKGARHRLTVLAEKLMGDDAEEVVKAVLKAARSGDMAAARLILDRIAPVRRGRPVEVDLPKVETAADVVQAIGTLAERVGTGDLTPEEAAIIADLLNRKREAIETVEFERRLAALEERAVR